MTQYIKNPDYEFIDDEKSIVILEPEMNRIFSLDLIGLKVLEKFNNPLLLDNIESTLEDTFSNINITELTELIDWLIENKIIVPYKMS